MVVEKIRNRIPNHWPVTVLVGASLFYWVLLYGRLIMVSQPSALKWFQFLAGVASISALLELPYRYFSDDTSVDSMSKTELIVRGGVMVVVSGVVFQWIFDSENTQLNASISVFDIGSPSIDSLLFTIFVVVAIAFGGFVLVRIFEDDDWSRNSEEDVEKDTRQVASEESANTDPKETGITQSDDGRENPHEETTGEGLTVTTNVPSNRCGYVFDPDPVSGSFAGPCCWREVWEDTNRCIWHADVENKPSSELRKSRLSRPEYLDGAILRNSDLGEVISFEECSLREADLSDGDFTEINFTGTNLKKTDCTAADFKHADLTDASLLYADLTDVHLQHADLVDALLGHADLTNAYFLQTDLSSADLGHADLTDADIWEIDPTDAYFGYTNLTDTDFADVDFSGVNLSYADLTNADLTKIDFTDANLRSTNLEGAFLEQGNLTRTNLFGADLTGAKLYGAVFNGTQISHATTFGDHYDEARSDEPPTADGDSTSAWDKARWTYRQLEQLARDNALPERAREYFVTHKQLRRQEYKRRSEWVDWVKASVSHVVMRYGEGPLRVVYTSLVLIIMFGLLYPFAGGIDETPTGDGTKTHALNRLIPDLVGPLPETAVHLLTSLYFSFVTFTTLGYGDIRPATGATQILATVESFLGALLMALLVFVLGRRSTW